MSVLALAAVTVAQAADVLEIQITRGVESALPIAIVPFAVEPTGPQPPQDVAAIVSADLARSGLFAPVPERNLVSRPREASEVNFLDWRLLGVDSLLIGQVLASGPGAYDVRFQLFDVLRGQPLAAYSVPATDKTLRLAAHHISDIVYEKLTGDKGAFATRIAYITASGASDSRLYELHVADSDGYDPQTILSTSQPLMSPAWSPNGEKLAYVSFEQGRAMVYRQAISTGQRELVASYPGLNTAPAWSPDGTRLALTLSKDGNPEIYLLDLRSKALQRVTNNLAIDTEPDWGPDGRSLVFTSDRGGQPQIYRIGISGGRPERLTFEGSYNACPRLSPDGRMLAMLHRGGDGYYIAVQDLASGSLRVLTDTRLDESPSFAPNGSMIIYATEAGGKGVLAAVSVDGRVSQRLASHEGDVREPAWSPFDTTH